MLITGGEIAGRAPLIAQARRLVRRQIGSGTGWPRDCAADGLEKNRGKVPRRRLDPHEKPPYKQRTNGPVAQW
ncbi:MAG: hypothetical protein B7Y80_11475 [Hyphomicrobium sp. 32-62-53]|nr:MAG: hypothetical protein B7Y80_11475 [Hyphomicrobium sp. 32-62-53]